MNLDPTVFVVDDDPDMRNSLRWLLESIGLRVETFATAEAFLETYAADRPGCLVLDVRMPGIGGLRLLEQLAEAGLPLPVILLTGHGEIAMAVQALKTGAFDFLEKPVPHQQILDRVRDALAVDRERRSRAAKRAAFSDRLAQLTQREYEVLNRMVEGESSKEIALALDISDRTVEKHRERLMYKMQARSAAHLIRLVVEHRESG